MNDVRLTTASKALPEYVRLTSEILPFVPLWLQGEPDRLIRKAVKIFEGAGGRPEVRHYGCGVCFYTNFL